MAFSRYNETRFKVNPHNHVNLIWLHCVQTFIVSANRTRNATHMLSFDTEPEAVGSCPRIGKSKLIIPNQTVPYYYTVF